MIMKNLIPYSFIQKLYVILFVKKNNNNKQQKIRVKKCFQI